MRKYIDSYIIKGIAFVAILLSVVAPTQAQETTEDSANKAKEEVTQFVNAFTDWAIISFSTYSGQNEAELGSLFAQLKDQIKDNPELKDFITDITSDLDGFGAAMQAITNETGLKVYIKPEKINNDEGFYVGVFNSFLAEAAKNPVSPYIIIKPIINGTKDTGYAISYAIEVSETIKTKGYTLTEPSEKNPFNALVATNLDQKAMGSALKSGLVEGLLGLSATITSNFLPDLYIEYAGDVIRPGDIIEVPMESGTSIELKLLEGGDVPKKTVTWTLDPDGDLVLATLGMTKDKVVIPTDTVSGQWGITAATGKRSMRIDLKIVNFSFDWKALLKTILYEALQSKLDQTQAKIDSLETIGSGLDSELQAKLIAIEAQNYPLEPLEGVELYSAYDEPQLLSGNDTTIFYSNKTRKEGFEKLRKFKKISVDILKQVNTAALIDILVEDPKRFEELMENFINQSGDLLVDIVDAAVNEEEQKGKLKKIVFDYLNANIEAMAVTAFSNEYYEERLSAAALPTTTATNIPSKQDDNFYINPLVYFNGVADFKAELKATLDTMTNPPFVVINYSQDLSSEGYIERGIAGKPKEIGDRPYLVYTLVNMPGSVMMTFISPTGEDPREASYDSEGGAIEDYLATALKELYDNSGGQNIGYGYCKKCEITENSIQSFELNKIITFEDLKCFIGIIDDESNVYQETETYNLSNSDISVQKTDFVSQASELVKNENEHAIFSILQDANSSLDLFPCNEYMYDKLSEWDFCLDEVSVSDVEIFNEIIKECLINNAVYQFDVDGALESIQQQIEKPIANDENIRVVINTPNDTKQAQSNLEAIDVDYEIIYSQGATGKWEISLNVSSAYLKNLGTRFNDPDLLVELIGYLEDIIEQSFVKFCGGELKPGCSDKPLELLQVVNINLQHLATNGVLHPAMWDSGDTKSNLIPEEYKIVAIPSGVVDGLVEDFMSIPLLVKTIFDVTQQWDAVKASMAKLFTKEGASRALDGIAESIKETWTNDEKLEHGVSKATVELALIYISWTAKTAKALNEVIESATSLASKLDTSPNLRKHLDGLVAKGASEGKVGVQKVSKLLDELAMDPEILDDIVTRLDEPQLGKFMDDLISSKSLRDEVSLDVELSEIWKKLDDTNLSSDLKENGKLLKEMKKIDCK